MLEKTGEKFRRKLLDDARKLKGGISVGSKVSVVEMVRVDREYEH